MLDGMLTIKGVNERNKTMECLDLFVRYASLTGPNRKKAMQADLSALRANLQVVQEAALQEGKQTERIIHVSVPGKELSVAAIDANGILLSGSLSDFMEGELCTVITSNERMYTGTLKKCDAGLGVRLDEMVSTEEDIVNLGIQAGDWVEADPRVHVTQRRFIKARNLRATSSFAILICALEKLQKEGRALAKGTELCIHFDRETSECREFSGISCEDDCETTDHCEFWSIFRGVDGGKTGHYEFSGVSGGTDGGNIGHYEYSDVSGEVDDETSKHCTCSGISLGTYCPEDFEETLRVEALAITAENGLDEYSVAVQGKRLERIAKEKNIPYKVISGMGKLNILAVAFQVDGFSERGHEEGIEAAARLLSAYLSE